MKLTRAPPLLQYRFDAPHINVSNPQEADMTMTMATNQAKAVHIARKLMKSFDVGDLEWFILDRMVGELEPLYRAIYPEYDHLKKQVCDLPHKILESLPDDTARDTFREYVDAQEPYADIKAMAEFYLGFETGRRLHAPGPDLTVVPGGRIHTLKGNSNL